MLEDVPAVESSFSKFSKEAGRAQFPERSWVSTLVGKSESKEDLNLNPDAADPTSNYFKVLENVNDANQWETHTTRAKQILDNTFKRGASLIKQAKEAVLDNRTAARVIADLKDDARLLHKMYEGGTRGIKKMRGLESPYAKALDALAIKDDSAIIDDEYARLLVESPVQAYRMYRNKEYEESDYVLDETGVKAWAAKTAMYYAALGVKGAAFGALEGGGGAMSGAKAAQVEAIPHTFKTWKNLNPLVLKEAAYDVILSLVESTMKSLEVAIESGDTSKGFVPRLFTFAGFIKSTNDAKKVLQGFRSTYEMARRWGFIEKDPGWLLFSYTGWAARVLGPIPTGIMARLAWTAELLDVTGLNEAEAWPKDKKRDTTIRKCIVDDIDSSRCVDNVLKACEVPDTIFSLGLTGVARFGGGKSGAYLWHVLDNEFGTNSGVPYGSMVLKWYKDSFKIPSGQPIAERPFREVTTLCKMSGITGYPCVYGLGCIAAPKNHEPMPQELNVISKRNEIEAKIPGNKIRPYGSKVINLWYKGIPEEGTGLYVLMSLSPGIPLMAIYSKYGADSDIDHSIGRAHKRHAPGKPRMVNKSGKQTGAGYLATQCVADVCGGTTNYKPDLKTPKSCPRAAAIEDESVFIAGVAVQLLILIESAKRVLGPDFVHFDMHPDNIFIDQCDPHLVRLQLGSDRNTKIEAYMLPAVHMIDFDLVMDQTTFPPPQWDLMLPEEWDKITGRGLVPERTLSWAWGLVGVNTLAELMRGQAGNPDHDMRNWNIIVQVLLHQCGSETCKAIRGPRMGGRNIISSLTDEGAVRTWAQEVLQGAEDVADEIDDNMALTVVAEELGVSSAEVAQAMGTGESEVYTKVWELLGAPMAHEWDRRTKRRVIKSIYVVFVKGQRPSWLSFPDIMPKLRHFFPNVMNMKGAPVLGSGNAIVLNYLAGGMDQVMSFMQTPEEATLVRNIIRKGSITGTDVNKFIRAVSSRLPDTVRDALKYLGDTFSASNIGSKTADILGLGQGAFDEFLAEEQNPEVDQKEAGGVTKYYADTVYHAGLLESLRSSTEIDLLKKWDWELIKGPAFTRGGGGEYRVNVSEGNVYYAQSRTAAAHKTIFAFSPNRAQVPILLDQWYEKVVGHDDRVATLRTGELDDVVYVLGVWTTSRLLQRGVESVTGWVASTAQELAAIGDPLARAAVEELQSIGEDVYGHGRRFVARTGEIASGYANRIVGEAKAVYEGLRTGVGRRIQKVQTVGPMIMQVGGVLWKQSGIGAKVEEYYESETARVAERVGGKLREVAQGVMEAARVRGGEVVEAARVRGGEAIGAVGAKVEGWEEKAGEVHQEALEAFNNGVASIYDNSYQSAEVVKMALEHGKRYVQGRPWFKKAHRTGAELVSLGQRAGMQVGEISGDVLSTATAPLRAGRRFGERQVEGVRRAVEGVGQFKRDVQVTLERAKDATLVMYVVKGTIRGGIGREQETTRFSRDQIITVIAPTLYSAAFACTHIVAMRRHSNVKDTILRSIQHNYSKISSIIGENKTWLVPGAHDHVHGVFNTPDSTFSNAKTRYIGTNENKRVAVTEIEDTAGNVVRAVGDDFPESMYVLHRYFAGRNAQKKVILFPQLQSVPPMRLSNFLYSSTKEHDNSAKEFVHSMFPQWKRSQCAAHDPTPSQHFSDKFKPKKRCGKPNRFDNAVYQPRYSSQSKQVVTTVSVGRSSGEAISLAFYDVVPDADLLELIYPAGIPEAMDTYLRAHGGISAYRLRHMKPKEEAKHAPLLKLCDNGFLCLLKNSPWLWEEQAAFDTYKTSDEGKKTEQALRQIIRVQKRQSRASYRKKAFGFGGDAMLRFFNPLLLLATAVGVGSSQSQLQRWTADVRRTVQMHPTINTAALVITSKVNERMLRVALADNTLSVYLKLPTSTTIAVAFEGALPQVILHFDEPFGVRLGLMPPDALEAQIPEHMLRELRVRFESEVGKSRGGEISWWSLPEKILTYGLGIGTFEDQLARLKATESWLGLIATYTWIQLKGWIANSATSNDEDLQKKLWYAVLLQAYAHLVRTSPGIAAVGLWGAKEYLRNPSVGGIKRATDESGGGVGSGMRIGVVDIDEWNLGYMHIFGKPLDSPIKGLAPGHKNWSMQALLHYITLYIDEIKITVAPIEVTLNIRAHAYFMLVLDKFQKLIGGIIQGAVGLIKKFAVINVKDAAVPVNDMHLNPSFAQQVQSCSIVLQLGQEFGEVDPIIQFITGAGNPLQNLNKIRSTLCNSILPILIPMFLSNIFPARENDLFTQTCGVRAKRQTDSSGAFDFTLPGKRDKEREGEEKKYNMDMRKLQIELEKLKAEYDDQKKAGRTDPSNLNWDAVYEGLGFDIEVYITPVEPTKTTWDVLKRLYQHQISVKALEASRIGKAPVATVDPGASARGRLRLMSSMKPFKPTGLLGMPKVYIMYLTEGSLSDCIKRTDGEDCDGRGDRPWLETSYIHSRIAQCGNTHSMCVQLETAPHNASQELLNDVVDLFSKLVRGNRSARDMKKVERGEIDIGKGFDELSVWFTDDELTLSVLKKVKENIADRKMGFLDVLYVINMAARDPDALRLLYQQRLIKKPRTLEVLKTKEGRAARYPAADPTIAPRALEGVDQGALSEMYRERLRASSSSSAPSYRNVPIDPDPREEAMERWRSMNPTFDPNIDQSEAKRGEPSPLSGVATPMVDPNIDQYEEKMKEPVPLGPFSKRRRHPQQPQPDATDWWADIHRQDARRAAEEEKEEERLAAEFRAKHPLRRKGPFSWEQSYQHL